MPETLREHPGADQRGGTPFREGPLGTLACVDVGHHHRNLTGGGARAAVFGLSDGLVSNVALILGIAGAHESAGAVRLAGVAGLIAGSFSMAAGEYVSMRAQSELMLRELDVERQAIHHDPEVERKELAAIYEGRGLETDLAEELSARMMRDPELALETHAREELGIDPAATGRPVEAASASFVTFAVGAFVPLLPWLLTSGNTATVWTIVLGALGAFAVGAALSVFTGRSWLFSASRQLLILSVAAAVTYGVGHLIGSG
jgi:vacuolar iron transporter family protein